MTNHGQTWPTTTTIEPPLNQSSSNHHKTINFKTQPIHFKPQHTKKSSQRLFFFFQLTLKKLGDFFCCFLLVFLLLAVKLLPVLCEELLQIDVIQRARNVNEIRGFYLKNERN
jgi:hypothetical protein